MSIKTKLTGLALLTSVAVAYSTGAQAGTQTWDFNNPPAFDFAGDGNSWSLTSSDGVNLTVTGWSNTQDVGGEDRVEDAELIWAQTSALGIVNRDESTSSPDHSVDSFASNENYDGDYDMLLLEFDTAVDLTGIDLKWARDGNSGNRSDISILAYDGTGPSGLSGQRWSEVLGGNYDSAGNYNNVGLNYYGVNSANVASSKWLIGVYNPVFGSGYGLTGDNDGFKLDYITTATDDTPPTGDVPVPGSFGLVLLGLVALRKRLMRG